ncbi:MAG: 1-acyl-sn-glycerol-3-phosphate acyltransferase [Saprospiraceae bacterium]|nr:1-acyl-sn-glycerol-3-phosphate acyltransferase [Saprospiraceae bacterium]
MKSTLPHIIPDIKKWPIYKISENRAEFISNLNAYTRSRLFEDNKTPVEDILDKTIYLEKLRVKNNPWKVDPVDDKRYWKELEKEIEVAKTFEDREDQLHLIVDRIINRYNEEIVGYFKLKTFKFSRNFLSSFFKRLLNPATFKGQKRMWGNRDQVTQKIKLHGYVDELRSIFQKGTVVIVPTHFSNLDSILIGYALDAVVGVPASSYGAGLNLLDNEIVAYFINRLGAYRVDRRKKNPIYLECLKSMASFSLQNNVNQIFFPGGTRARDGKLEDKLKLGLLGSMVEAQRHAIANGDDNKIYVVPLVLNYHFVLEAKSLIDQYLRRTGKEKYTKSRETGKPSGKLMKFIWSIIRKQSDIELSFGRPMDVFGHPVDEEGNSLDKHGNIIDISGYFKLDGEVQTVYQREKVYTKLLGDKIVESYKVNNVVLSSHLVAFAAFRILLNQHSELNLYDVLNIPPAGFEIEKELFLKVIRKMQTTLKRLEKQGKLRLSKAMQLSPEELIEDGVKHLGLYHPQKVLKVKKDGALMSENFRLLYFYHNRLDSYQLEQTVKWEDLIKISDPILENSIL